jgi:hypothetical protein
VKEDGPYLKATEDGMACKEVITPNWSITGLFGVKEGLEQRQ